MKKKLIQIIVLLIVFNVGFSLYKNNQIVVDDLDQFIEEFIENDETINNASEVFKDEAYQVLKSEDEVAKSYDQLYEQSDLIVVGSLNKRVQETDLIISKIDVDKVIKGSVTNSNIKIIEPYGIYYYAKDNINCMLNDPFYGPILENKEYIFFLDELYDGMYTYTDHLLTKFPTKDQIIVGEYDIREVETPNGPMKFPAVYAKTFFASDILHAKKEYDIFHNSDLYDLNLNYVDIYLKFNEYLKELNLV